MPSRNRQIITISGIFVFFALLSVLIGTVSERNYKQAVLSSKLEAFCDVVAVSDPADSIAEALPEGMRVSVVSSDGTVLYDSQVPAGGMDNHLERPEIQAALKDGAGYSVRTSDTSGEKYFYFAKAYPGKIVRCAQAYDLRHEDRPGSDRMLLLSIFLLLVIALLIIFRVSEKYDRKEIEEADRDRRRLKHELTGNISHEMKTPVSSILGYLETIVNHPELDPQKRQLFIERSYLQALRLTDLISDISLITKLEEVPEQFKIEPVNIKVVFSEVCDEMAERLQAGGITVKNELPPICIRGNYNLIYSIFRNLVENTAKYAGGPCTAVIRYREDGQDGHCFDYLDTGKGVKDDELEKIFERFYRLDTDRSNPQGGSGLGLSIIRNAVHFHHGNIRAYNIPGGGLGFRFNLRDLKLN